MKIGDVPSGEGFGAAGKQFFRRNPGGFQGKIVPSRGQKIRRLGMLTCFKQALSLCPLAAGKTGTLTARTPVPPYPALWSRLNVLITRRQASEPDRVQQQFSPGHCLRTQMASAGRPARASSPPTATAGTCPPGRQYGGGRPPPPGALRRGSWRGGRRRALSLIHI